MKISPVKGIRNLSDERENVGVRSKHDGGDMRTLWTAGLAAILLHTFQSAPMLADETTVVAMLRDSTVYGSREKGAAGSRQLYGWRSKGQVHLRNCAIEAGPGTVVLVEESADLTRICTLCDRRRSAVTVTLASSTYFVQMGEELMLSKSTDSLQKRLQNCTHGRRNTHWTRDSTGTIIVTSEINLLDVVRADNLKSRMPKAIRERVLKSIVCLATTGGQHGADVNAQGSKSFDLAGLMQAEQQKFQHPNKGTFQASESRQGQDAVNHPGSKVTPLQGDMPSLATQPKLKLVVCPFVCEAIEQSGAGR